MSKNQFLEPSPLTRSVPKLHLPNGIYDSIQTPSPDNQKLNPIDKPHSVLGTNTFKNQFGSSAQYFKPTCKPGCNFTALVQSSNMISAGEQSPQSSYKSKAFPQRAFRVLRIHPVYSKLDFKSFHNTKLTSSLSLPNGSFKSKPEPKFSSGSSTPNVSESKYFELVTLNLTKTSTTFGDMLSTPKAELKSSKVKSDITLSVKFGRKLSLDSTKSLENQQFNKEKTNFKLSLLIPRLRKYSIPEESANQEQTSTKVYKDPSKYSLADIRQVQSNPWRHLIFSPKYNKETLKKHLITVYNGLVYLTKSLHGPSEKFLKLREICLDDSEAQNSKTYHYFLY